VSGTILAKNIENSNHPASLDAGDKPADFYYNK
jgi:hypothetical protein